MESSRSIQRKDGQSTRKRILEAALVIFGEKGYHDTTHAEVCELAEANIAAINYHFGSKEHLYRAVCEHAIAAMESQYPPGGNVPESAPLEARLRGHIESIIKRGHVDGPLRYYHRIRMTERFSPTGLADDIWEAWFKNHYERLQPIIAGLLGAGASHGEIVRCQMSVMSQCFIANSILTSGKPHQIEAAQLEDEALVIDHIVRFGLAGVRAVAESRARKPEDRSA